MYSKDRDQRKPVHGSLTCTLRPMDRQKEVAHLAAQRARMLIRGTIGPDKLPSEWVLVFALPGRWGTWCYSQIDGPWVALDMMRHHLGELGTRTDFERAVQSSGASNRTWVPCEADPKVVETVKSCALQLEHLYRGIQWIFIFEDGRGLPLLSNIEPTEIPAILLTLVRETESKLVRPWPGRASFSAR